MKISEYNFTNKRALIRVDFNVPLDENLKVSDDSRIRAAIPTIEWVLNHGGAVVLMSHLGRPKSGAEDKFSLSHLISTLEDLLSRKVDFGGDCIGNKAIQLTKNAIPGQIILLENLRFYNEEKQGDPSFAAQLAKHGDVYINDAFGTAHRAHASTAVIAQYFPQDKLFGFLMENEIENLELAMFTGKKPKLAIIGGAKVSSKIDVLNNLVSKVQHIIIGGGMAFTFVKAKGGETGISLVEEDKCQLALDILNRAEQNGTKIHLPVDTITGNSFSENATTALRKIQEIPKDEMGLDIGPESIELFKNVISQSETIIWNGPMGVFEMKPFESGTKELALAVAEATGKGAYSLVGGGDSVAAINQFKLNEKVSYVSTGGGAMLEFLEGKQLPGIEAVRSDY